MCVTMCFLFFGLLRLPSFFLFSFLFSSSSCLVVNLSVVFVAFFWFSSEFAVL